MPEHGTYTITMTERAGAIGECPARPSAEVVVDATFGKEPFDRSTGCERTIDEQACTSVIDCDQSSDGVRRRTVNRLEFSRSGATGSSTITSTRTSDDEVTMSCAWDVEWVAK
ncbi:MAG: hypothetical protein KF894_00540 [Labilithrix sp.]|nr:hypothetical protein [Labilithrix sp.]